MRDPTLWALFVFWFIFLNALSIHLHHHVPISFMTIIPSVVLHSSEENNLSKGNHLAEDEPDINHLDVRGGGQALHLADEVLQVSWVVDTAQVRLVCLSSTGSAFALSLKSKTLVLQEDDLRERENDISGGITQNRRTQSFNTIKETRTLTKRSSPYELKVRRKHCQAPRQIEVQKVETRQRVPCY